MNREIYLGAAVAVLLAYSCAAPKLDTSTEDTFRQSAAAARDSLDPQLQSRFDEALESIRLNALKGSEGDEFSSDVRLRQMVNSKTATEIVDLGTRLDLADISSLRKRIEEADAISKEISFSDITYKMGMVHATSHNNTGHEVLYHELQIIFSDGTEGSSISSLSDKIPTGDSEIELYVLGHPEVRYNPDETEPTVTHIYLRRLGVIDGGYYSFPPLTPDESERLSILEERHGDEGLP